MTKTSGTRLGRTVDAIEEATIALLLAAMTIITFANVVARYIFNANILWALETTVYLFAWLVLLGVSYGVRKQIHIGVDVLIDNVPPTVRRILTVLAVLCCLAFSLLILKGSWDYWYPFATKRAFLVTEDVPMPDFLQFLSTWLNQGERYEKLPRLIPYFALPLGMALLTLRYLVLTWEVITGKQDTIIANHEVEEIKDFKEQVELEHGGAGQSIDMKD
jgi:C4-dicarboxylate transporter DctQ subunit